MPRDKTYMTEVSQKEFWQVEDYLSSPASTSLVGQKLNCNVSADGAKSYVHPTTKATWARIVAQGTTTVYLVNPALIKAALRR